MSLNRLTVALLCLLPLAAEAASIDGVRKEVENLERLAQGLTIRTPEKPKDVGTIAAHRLVDAEVLYHLEDYGRAAIILYDYVTQYRDTPGYPEALFYLGDSLFQRRDFLSARRYFTEIVKSARGPYYQESLARLIEISLETGDTSEIRAYLSALDQIPAGKVKAAVPYVKGKYLYFSDDDAGALLAFSKVPANTEYSLQAKYFIGATHVKLNQLETAEAKFNGLLKQTNVASSKEEAQPADDAGQFESSPMKARQHVIELTYLALGRLAYQKGAVKQAIDWYRRVAAESDLYDTALYEIAWAYVRAEYFEEALRALDLLIFAQPHSTLLPEVRVLQANLLIRMQKWGGATEMFTQTRDEYEPIRQELGELLAKHSDPGLFFDLLLKRELDRLTIRVKVPEIALSWVREKPEVKRALLLVEALRDIQGSIRANQDLIRRLDQAVNSPAKVKVFPHFAAAHAASLSIDNRAIRAALLAVELQTEKLRSKLTGVAADRFADMETRKKELKRKLFATSEADSTFSDRDRALRDQLSRLRRQISEMSVVIDSLAAQLVATERFYEDTQTDSDREPSLEFLRDAKALRDELGVLSDEARNVRVQLRYAADETGLGGSREVAEKGMKSQLWAVLIQMNGLLQSVDGSIDTQGASQLLGRLGEVRSKVDAFDQRVLTAVDESLKDVRSVLNEERLANARQTSAAVEIHGGVNDVAGGTTLAGFREVHQRFYEIMVRSDVGIIDVAWALKDAKTREVSSLVRQRKLDLKLLDDEFSPVLGSDVK